MHEAAGWKHDAKLVGSSIGTAGTFLRVLEKHFVLGFGNREIVTAIILNNVFALLSLKVFCIIHYK